MTVAQIICLIVVLILSVLSGYLIVKKSEKHDLLKWILLFIFIAMSLTWIFSYGYFNGAEFSDYGMSRLGLTDIPNVIYYAMNFAGDKIIYLLALGCFYAVLSKVDGYKKLVSRIAESFKGKEIIFVVFTSLIITAMASLFSQTFVALTFVPFVISIILSMKLDKMTAFSTTFGAVLIGTLGYTYGGEGLEWFNYYTSMEITTALVYRLIVLVVAFILFNVFNVLHAKKTLKDANVNEVSVDPFEVKKFDKKAKTWPIIVILSVLFILTILGYVGWENHFGITVFKEFHTWLFELKIGDVEIFAGLLGSVSTSTPFGAWNLFHMSTLLFVVSIVVALIGRVSVNEFIDSCTMGAKKMSKGIILFVLVYMVMIIAYMSPFVPSIMNTIFSGISKFNPFLVFLGAFISNVFHTDFGYTGYVVGTFFTNSYANDLTLINLIFTSMYGFVQLCLPTSAVLLIGLSYLDIDYKTWIKYAWMFLVGILVVLLVLFAVLAYI